MDGHALDTMRCARAHRVAAVAFVLGLWPFDAPDWLATLPVSIPAFQSKEDVGRGVTHLARSHSSHAHSTSTSLTTRASASFISTIASS